MGSDGSSTQVEARPQNPRLRWQDCLLISIHWSPYICSRFESFETGLMSMILMRTCSPSCVSGIYKAVSYVFFFFFFLLNVALSPMRISSRALGPGFMKW